MRFFVLGVSTLLESVYIGVSLKVPLVYRRDYPGSTYEFFSPGVDLSRCKDHVVFRIQRIACSRLRKVVRNFVPEKAYMRRELL
ncbi:hypothetical protein TNCV_958881 [Trichonephila clavipes]|nr:hypothetical protein TNCV_958881 [Trichonephila clavipes]